MTTINQFIPLTVETVDNYPLTTPTVSVFDMERMSGLQANQNPTNQTFSVVNSASAITKIEISPTNSWATFTGLFNGLYTYTLVVAGAVTTFTLYNDPNMTNAIAQGTGATTGTITVLGLNDNIISGTITLSATVTANESGTLTVTNVQNVTSLQVAGATQFMYRDLLEVKRKYTVLETIYNITQMTGLPVS